MTEKTIEKRKAPQGRPTRVYKDKVERVVLERAKFNLTKESGDGWTFESRRNMNGFD
jgi:hypothetical protein